MKKKFLTLALATAMVVSSALAVSAEVVSEDTTFTGAVADGSEGWNSAGTGKTFAVTEDGVTVVFHNDAFTDSVDHGNGDKFGETCDNWDNFVFETLASESAAGITLRADSHAWTYGDNTTNVPTWDCKTTWGVDKVKGVSVDSGATEDWTNFQALTDDTDITFNAKKTDANTVVFTMTYASDASAKQTYTVTYPNGVPADLQFQIGADGGKVELKSAKLGEEEPSETPTTTAPEGETTTAAPESTTAAPEKAPATGDASNSVVLLAVAAAAVAGVVVLKKKTVTE